MATYPMPCTPTFRLGDGLDVRAMLVVAESRAKRESLRTARLVRTRYASGSSGTVLGTSARGIEELDDAGGGSGSCDAVRSNFFAWLNSCSDMAPVLKRALSLKISSATVGLAEAPVILVATSAPLRSPSVFAEVDPAAW